MDVYQLYNRVNEFNSLNFNKKVIIKGFVQEINNDNLYCIICSTVDNNKYAIKSYFEHLNITLH